MIEKKRVGLLVFPTLKEDKQKAGHSRANPFLSLYPQKEKGRKKTKEMVDRNAYDGGVLCG